jgi:cell pole-organizing protein PopZ
MKKPTGLVLATICTAVIMTGAIGYAATVAFRQNDQPTTGQLRPVDAVITDPAIQQAAVEQTLPTEPTTAPVPVADTTMATDVSLAVPNTPTQAPVSTRIVVVDDQPGSPTTAVPQQRKAGEREDGHDQSKDDHIKELEHGDD